MKLPWKKPPPEPKIVAAGAFVKDGQVVQHLELAADSDEAKKLIEMLEKLTGGQNTSISIGSNRPDLSQHPVSDFQRMKTLDQCPCGQDHSDIDLNKIKDSLTERETALWLICMVLAQASGGRVQPGLPELVQSNLQHLDIEFHEWRKVCEINNMIARAMGHADDEWDISEVTE